jgi:cytochrome c-type biogenesis protein CcmF
MGVCPLIAWRKAGWKNLRRNFLVPTIIGAMAVILLMIAGFRQWTALLFFFASIFTLATVFFEFNKGTQARMAMVRESAATALYRLVQRNKRRYGGFIIHAGFALLFIGIAASSFFQFERDVVVQPDGSFAARNYTIYYRQLTESKDPHKEVVQAKLEIFKNGKSLGFVYPERHFYKNSDQPTTEVALKSFWHEDLYLILIGWDEKGAATFKVYINPLVGLIWQGGLLMALGGLIVLFPDFRPGTAVVTVRESAAAQESS